MTAMFTLLPHQFHDARFDGMQQGFVFAATVIGLYHCGSTDYHRRKTANARRVFGVFSDLGGGIGILAVASQTIVGLIIGLAVYYIGFNSLGGDHSVLDFQTRPLPTKRRRWVLTHLHSFGCFLWRCHGRYFADQTDVVVMDGARHRDRHCVIVYPADCIPPYLTSLTITPANRYRHDCMVTANFGDWRRGWDSDDAKRKHCLSQTG